MNFMTVISNILTFGQHLLTQNDNKTADIKAVSTLLLVLGLITWTGFSVWNGGHFSAMDFGTGGGALVGGYGLGRKLDSDPTESEDLLKAGKEKP